MAGNSGEPGERGAGKGDPLPPVTQPAQARFELRRVRSVNVVDLRLPVMLDSSEFDRLNESLLTELRGRAAEMWLLNVAGVSYMGSAMLGLLVNLRQQVVGDRGELVLCEMSPGLLRIFQTTSLQRLFRICRTLDEGLEFLERRGR